MTRVTFLYDDILKNLETDSHHGKNGTGKIKFLEIICGLQKPEGGLVNLSKNSVIGFLRGQKCLDLERASIEIIENGKYLSTKGSIIDHLKDSVSITNMIF